MLLHFFDFSALRLVRGHRAPGIALFVLCIANDSQVYMKVVYARSVYMPSFFIKKKNPSNSSAQISSSRRRETSISNTLRSYFTRSYLLKLSHGHGLQEDLYGFQESPQRISQKCILVTKPFLAILAICLRTSTSSRPIPRRRKRLQIIRRGRIRYTQTNSAISTSTAAARGDI